ncbi:MAG: hypothetical protein WD271_15145 [Acidimicrobiia bacterium]
MRTVHVDYHEEDGLWWADSPDVPGFSATAEELRELRQLAREGIYHFLDEVVLVSDDTTVSVQGVCAFVNISASTVFVPVAGAPESQAVEPPELVNN